MLTDIGEYIVGAYLSLMLECDVIDYNVRPPGGGLKGLEEIDVIGFNLKTNQAYLCEVTTHIRGTLYGDNKMTVYRIRNKHVRLKQYSAIYLKQFKCEYMFWSPVVPIGYITNNLAKIKGLQLIINGEYKKRFEELRVLASLTTHDARNPVFRVLQIMGHLRG
jgi:hypothetical protein